MRLPVYIIVVSFVFENFDLPNTCNGVNVEIIKSYGQMDCVKLSFLGLKILRCNISQTARAQNQVTVNR